MTKFPKRLIKRRRPEFSRRINSRVRVEVNGWVVETILLRHTLPIPPIACDLGNSIAFQEFLENPHFPEPKAARDPMADLDDLLH